VVDEGTTGRGAAAPGTAGGAVRPRRRKGRVARVRSAIRRLIGRPEPIPPPPPPPPSTGFGIEQLHRADLVRDDHPGYRLNLVVPTLDAARVFGGIRTAMDLFEAVAGSAAERRVVAATARPAPQAPAVPAATDPLHQGVDVVGGGDADLGERVEQGALTVAFVGVQVDAAAGDQADLVPTPA